MPDQQIGTVEDQTTLVKPEPGKDVEELSDDEGAIEQAGKKFVPLSAVSKAREKTRLAKERADKLEGENAQFKDFAQKAQPWLDALKSRPDIVESLRTGEVPASKTTAAEEIDPTLVDMAKSLDLYDAQAKPDVGRAKTIREFIRREAQAVAVETVRPWAQTTAQGQSEVNFQRMASLRGKKGQTIAPEYLKQFWALANQPGADVLANPEAAMITALAAAGYQYLYGEEPAKVQMPGEPLVSESAGGRHEPMALTERHQRLARELGQTPEQFAKNVQTVLDRKGVLE